MSTSDWKSMYGNPRDETSESELVFAGDKTHNLLNTMADDPDEYGVRKSQFPDENQNLAVGIAEEVRELAQKGITSGMRLALLENLPQVTIKAPYVIAKSLLDALNEPALWSLPTDYLVRATIARLARRYMMDHIFLNRVAFFASGETQLKDTLKEVLGIASLRDNSWMESGVLVQCKVLSMLINAASSTELWWRALPLAASSLFDSYSSKNPVLALKLISSITTKVGSMVGHEHELEFQLQVDNVYWTLGDSNPKLIDSALQSLSEMLQLNNSWKNLYTALSCLEWAIHREKFSKTQIAQLKPRLEVLTTIKSVRNFGLKGQHSRVCEKVATILIKLSQRNCLTDLLANMRANEHDSRISRLLQLTPKELYVEPRLSTFMNIHALSNFTGRESEIEEAKDRLTASKIVRIVGPAGNGKTSLATTLVFALGNNFEIVWKCSADSEAKLSASLKQLATRLKLGDDFSELLNYMNSHQVLLVLDNLDFQLPDMYRGLLEGNIRVIITSRNVVQTEILQIRGLESNAALDFVIGLTQRDSERQDVESLCKELSYLPLALKNVSALLNANVNDSVAKITQWIKESPTQLDTVNSDTSPRMMKVLEECVKKVTSEAGKRLLLITVDLSPDIIPELLYKEIFAGDEEELRKAKREAQALSLIEEDEQHNLSVHRLVQQSIRNYYSDQVRGLLPAKVQALLHLFQYEELSELSITLFKSIDGITNVFKNKSLLEPEELSLCIRYVSFCMKKLGNVKVVTEMCQKCGVWWKKRGIVTAQNDSDLEDLAMCCLEISNFEEAEQFMCDILEFHQKGNNQEILWRSYSNLALVYSRQGKLEKAEQLNLQALKIEEEVLPPTDPSIATSYANLASVYEDQGKLEEAEEFNLKALKIEEAVLPPRHPSLATAYSNLALVYHDQGKLEEAEEFNLKALNIEEAVLSPTHPNLITSYSNLAIVYQAQGKLEEAEEYNLKALKIEEAVLPPTHPDLATAYSNLSVIYQTQGKLGEAEEFNLKALKIEEAVLPPTHPSLATSYSNLASVYQDQGKLEEAEQFNLKAMKIMEEVLPPTHPDLVTLYASLSAIYQDQGKFEDAEKFNLKGLKIEEEVLPPMHPSLATSYANIAFVYQAQGKLEEAEQFNLKALKIEEATLSPIHYGLATSYSNLASVYEDQGQLGKAEQFSLKALKIEEEILHPTHPKLAASYSNLSAIYHAQGKLEEAEQSNVKALKIEEANLPPTHPTLATSYFTLSVIYLAQGKLDEAEQFNLKALKIREAVLPPTHPDLAASYSNLADVYEAQGRPNEAHELRQKIRR